MQVKKFTELKLFYNKSHTVHYVQIGDGLYVVKERVARIISEREDLEIRSGEDLKAIQIMSNEDKK